MRLDWRRVREGICRGAASELPRTVARFGGLVGGGAEVGRGWVSRELRNKGGFGRGLGGGWGRRGLGPAAEGGLRWPAGGAGEGTWWPAAVGGVEES